MSVAGGAWRNPGRCEKHLDEEVRGRLGRLRVRLQSRVTEPVEQDWEPWVRFWLCGHCHFLSEEQGACPSCGLREWVDLRSYSIARAHAVMDEEPLHRLPWWAHGLAWCGAGLMFAGLIGVTVTVTQQLQPSATGIVLFVFALGVGFGLSSAAVPWLRLSLARRLQSEVSPEPLRWRRSPLPLPSSLETTSPLVAADGEAQGTSLEATSEALQAPLSHRSCVGVRVWVYLQDPTTAYRQIWVLDQAAVAPALDEARRREVIRALEESSPTPLEPEGVALSHADLAAWLRERGVFPDGRTLLLCEAVVTSAPARKEPDER